MGGVMNKRGFGLIEVLIAAVVLGFLLVGLNNLQKGNREVVLRIRSRDVAQIIAQDILDSLSRLGASSIDITQAFEPKIHKWEGQIGIVPTTYSITAKEIEDPEGKDKSEESSKLIENTPTATGEHTISKNIELIVSWPFKNSMQSISMQRIIK